MQWTVEQMQQLGVYISHPRSPQETDHPFAEPGLFVINAPYGFDDAAKEVSDLFARLNAGPM